MKLLISGSSGMIGSFLVPYLEQRGHSVTRLVRHSPGKGEVSWDPDAGIIDAAGLEGFDGVVNLATMPWPARWTNSAKQAMLKNRLATNGLLAKNLALCQRKPPVLICSSGMGIYLPSGDQMITEKSSLGSDFLATFQQEGETAAMQASAAGIRVVNLRTPAVIGGAALQRNVGKMGNGQQWSSWVSRDELASIIEFILQDEKISGPVNPCSPNPVRNIEYVKIFSQCSGTKPTMAVPAFLLKLMVGEMGDALILASRRIQPRKLLDQGYRFRFPDLETALHHELELN